MWLLVAAVAVLSALTGVARSRQVRGRRLWLNAPARGWAIPFQALAGLAGVLAVVQLRASGGRAGVVVGIVFVAFVVPFVAVWFWHNHRWAGRSGSRPIGTGSRDEGRSGSPNGR